MCGIAGFITGAAGNTSASLEDAAQTAANMAAQLHHRGPDSSAFYFDDHALLVHTRLSIIDLAGGTQPIHNEDKTVWVVFNGEIYNYIELRQELEAQGHQFYTHSDTEVIVHLYEQYGEEFVQYLNGQFAICLWDKRRQKAMLIRDRVGIAPLFYQMVDGCLWFGSEVKAIIAGTKIKPELDTVALNQLMTFWAPVSPASIFKGVEEVSPGEQIVFDLQSLAKTQYWDLDFPAVNDYEAMSEQEAADNIHDLLVDATKIRLRADVPVAAYLSGGLDSSVLTSVIHHHSDSKLRTFSLTFEDSGLDEAEYQSQLVQHLNTTHSSVSCANSDVGEYFQESIWHTEAPIIRTAPVPMGLLSRHVRENNIKVVLTGEGADEVLGGYDIFKETKIRHFWSQNPDSAWRPLLIQRLYPYLKMPAKNANKFLANFFGGGVHDPNNPLFSLQPRMASTGKVKQFLLQEHQTGEQPAVALTKRLPKSFEDWSYFAKAQYLEMKTLMGGYLLSSQGDRMLMKNSVEGRFPFLDHRLIEYANRLHPKLKMKVLNEKFILKKAMQRYLPSTIVKRYKQPYRAPMIDSFYGDKPHDYVESLLSSESIQKFGYFDTKKTELLQRKIKAGRATSYGDNMAFVVMLSTQSWHQQFVEEFDRRFSAVPSQQASALQRIS